MSDPGVGLFARQSDRLERWVQVGMAGGRVIKVDFLVDRPAGAEMSHSLLDRFDRYLETGEPMAFDDVEIALTGPTDHRPAYDTLRQVPFGTSVTVEEIVARTAQLPDDDGGTHTVREAIENNPIPVIIPDHRVDNVTGSTPPAVRESLRALEELD